MSSAAKSLIAWLAGAASERSEAPALIDESGVLSYGQLWEALGRWRHVFTDAGLNPGTPVAVITRHRRRIARAAWLSVYSGLPLLPLEPSQLGLASLLRSCGVRQAIIDPEVELPRGIRRLPAARLDGIPDGPGAGPAPLAGNRPQLLISTSGTGDHPRAAMLTGDNLVASAVSTGAVLGLADDDNWLACLPLTHVAGLMIVFRSAAAGGAVTIHERYDADTVWSAISAGEITRISLVPPMLERLLNVSAGEPGARMRGLVIGGAPVSSALADRAREAGWPLNISYGMTETASHVALGGPDPGAGLTPVSGTRISVVDEQGQPTDGMGRIVIEGPTVMAGYANPGLLQGDGLPDPGRFVTSDLGEIDAQGRLRVAGRSDDVLSSGGVNVQPAALEDVLAGCPGVMEAGITGQPDPVWGHRLVAVYVGDVTQDELERWIEKNLAPPLRPRHFIRVSSLPRNTLGKLDRRLLQLMAESVDGES